MQGVVLPIVRATEGEVPMCCMGFLLHLLFPVCPLMCALVMSSHAVSVIYSSHKNIHCKKLGSFLQTYILPLELPVWAHAQLHEMTLGFSHPLALQQLPSEDSSLSSSPSYIKWQEEEEDMISVTARYTKAGRASHGQRGSCRQDTLPSAMLAIAFQDPAALSLLEP